MPILFLVTFVSVLGFGLIIPLLPFYIERFGGGPELITLIVAVHSLMQFLAGPIIGRLSDRYGRRAVLAWTTFGTILAHVLLGFADNLWLVILSRCLAGAMAANLGVTFAYAADITTAAQRPKAMGILSAGFSLGFMVGPGIGGLLAGAEVESANFALPAFSAAGLAFVAWVCILLFLTESMRPEDRLTHTDAPQVSLARQLRITLSVRTLLLIGAVSFLLYMAWSMFLAIFALWVNRVLDQGPTEIGFLYMFSGLIGVVAQFTLIGPLAKRVGERNIVLVTVIWMGIGLVFMALATNVVMTVIALALMSASHSIFTPIVTSIASKEATPRDRGVVLGVFQAIGGLGRVAGPLFSGVAFAQIGYSSPYLIGAALMLVGGVIAVRAKYPR
jgi:MFS family permease